MKLRLLAAVCTAALCATTVGGCGSTAGTSSTAVNRPARSGSAVATYPRTVTLGASTVTITKRVERLVALSPDVADVAMMLLGTERIAAVPELNKRPEQSVNATTAARIPQTIATTGSIDPEKVLALNPDLVMLTTRHGAEQDALRQLTAAGVPVLAVENDWDSPEAYARNVTAIAQAMGVEDKGKAQLDAYHARYAKVTEAVKAASSKPVTATLRVLGPNTWINGPTTIGYRVLNDAAATNVADQLGLKSSTKLDNEQLVKTNPAWLVVVDSNGQGRKQYDALLTNPGLASVEAIQKDHICVITSADIASGTGGIRALELIAKCLHPDLVK